MSAAIAQPWLLVVAERPKWPRQIDQLGLIHTEKRKTVYILCNIPLDIPVAELLLPDLWVTEKAAERWIVKEPPEAQNSGII